MPTVTGICNKALSRIGANPITNITESTREARACKAVYDTILDEMLEQAQWNFAIKRATLAQDSGTPEYDYSYQYLLPADCIRMLNVYPVSEYRVEGGMVRSNETTLQCRYLARITDASKYPPSFTRAMSLLLASEIALPIAGDTEGSGKKMNILKEFYDVALPAAMSRDARECGETQAEYQSDWASEGR